MFEVMTHYLKPGKNFFFNMGHPLFKVLCHAALRTDLDLTVSFAKKKVNRLQEFGPNLV